LRDARASIESDDSVEHAELSPDGKALLVGGYGRVWLRDLATQKTLRAVNADSGYSSAKFNPNGKQIAVTSGNKVQLWNGTLTEALRNALHHGERVKSVWFSANGAQVVTSSLDGTARIWDTESGEPRGEPFQVGRYALSAMLTPDGRIMIICSSDYSPKSALQLWDVASHKRLFQLTNDIEELHFSISSDGRKLAISFSDKTVRVLPLEALVAPALPVPLWMRDLARSMAGYSFNDDGEMKAILNHLRLATIRTKQSGQDTWSRLSEWLTVSREACRIHPDEMHTCREIAERERDFGSQESLESALRYDPAVPLVRLMLAKFEKNPQRAAFLRDYDLNRLPGDAALWSRAAQSLHEQGDDTRARRALDKFATLAPDQARTLKTQLGL
jgi:dipeptidyl aminopeptidase/acylaminoacyl peptidase